MVYVPLHITQKCQKHCFAKVLEMWYLNTRTEWLFFYTGTGYVGIVICVHCMLDLFSTVIPNDQYTIILAQLIQTMQVQYLLSLCLVDDKDQSGIEVFQEKDLRLL